MQSIRLLLADDHQVFLEGLKMLLQTDIQFTVVAEALNGQEVLHQLAEHPIDVAILDLTMPIMDGITTTRHITQHYPATKVLILSMNNQRSLILQAVQAGAKGYVIKSAGRVELLEAIRKVALGHQYFSSDVASVLMYDAMNHLSTLSIQHSEPLRTYEKEVFLGQGVETPCYVSLYVTMGFSPLPYFFS
jgi:DNA-binding NarL/FixJ family response regulator